MRDAVVIAAPGGNPALLAALLWALYRQESIRVRQLELILYGNARHYLEREFFAQDRPLSQLRAVLGEPALAQVVSTPVRLPGGSILEDDADPNAQILFTDALWQLARSLQQSPVPILYALVGGRRRTLTVTMSTTFQLLGRPQDRLVDLRLSPKYADLPGSRFYFPEQRTPAQVPTRAAPDQLVGADAVQVQLVDVPVPRLRGALLEAHLSSFSLALQAGEQAIEQGAIPKVTLDVHARTVHVGSLPITLTNNELVWFLTLIRERMETAEGWVKVQMNPRLEETARWCRELWNLVPNELSEAYDDKMSDEQRLSSLRPIRSRLRRRLREALKGHPHRSLIIPTLRRTRPSTERILVPPERLQVTPTPSWQTS